MVVFIQYMKHLKVKVQLNTLDYIRLKAILLMMDIFPKIMEVASLQISISNLGNAPSHGYLDQRGRLKRELLHWSNANSCARQMKFNVMDLAQMIGKFVIYGLVLWRVVLDLKMARCAILKLTREDEPCRRNIILN